MSEFTQNWFVVPNRIMQLDGLTLAYLRVFETIFQFWNNGQKCFLSNQKIMERTGIKSERTIQEALSYFEKHQELVRQTNKTGQRYLIQPQQIVQISDEELSTAPAVECAPPPQQSAPPPRSKLRDNNNKIKANKLNTTKSFSEVQKKHITNKKKHDFADSMNAMASEDRHAKNNEVYKRTPMPKELKSIIDMLKFGAG